MGVGCSLAKRRQERRYKIFLSSRLSPRRRTRKEGEGEFVSDAKSRRNVCRRAAFPDMYIGWATESRLATDTVGAFAPPPPPSVHFSMHLYACLRLVTSTETWSHPGGGGVYECLRGNFQLAIDAAVEMRFVSTCPHVSICLVVLSVCLCRFSCRPHACWLSVSRAVTQ